MIEVGDWYASRFAAQGKQLYLQIQKTNINNGVLGVVIKLDEPEKFDYFWMMPDTLELNYIKLEDSALITMLSLLVLLLPEPKY
jgi:hypothetical protein